MRRRVGFIELATPESAQGCPLFINASRMRPIRRGCACIISAHSAPAVWLPKKCGSLSPEGLRMIFTLVIQPRVPSRKKESHRERLFFLEPGRLVTRSLRWPSAHEPALCHTRLSRDCFFRESDDPFPTFLVVAEGWGVRNPQSCILGGRDGCARSIPHRQVLSAVSRYVGRNVGSWGSTYPRIVGTIIFYKCCKSQMSISPLSRNSQSAKS